MGEAGDEVEVEVGEAGGAGALQVGEHGGAGMEAADGAGLGVVEGLHAEAEAVDAGGDEGVERRGREGAGGDLDGVFEIGGELEVFADGGGDQGEVAGGEQGGGATAPVEGVEGGAGEAVVGGGEGKLAGEQGGVFVVDGGGEDGAGEVAVAALAAAERHRQVQPEAHGGPRRGPRRRRRRRRQTRGRRRAGCG